MVAASGEGRMRQAPQRSTMQRFLIMTNVTMLFLMSLLMILMMTLQLVMMLIRRMATMTPHWSGCENRNTGPDVLIVSEVRIFCRKSFKYKVTALYFGNKNYKTSKTNIDDFFAN